MTQFVDNFLDSLPEFEPISRLLVQFEDKFDAWIKSDNVWQDKDDRYLTQCSQYKIPMTLEQLETYFKKEYIE